MTTTLDGPPTAVEHGTDPAAIEAFIGRWQESGGSETANFQMFANELCGLLDLSCCSARRLDADRRSNVLILFDVRGSNEDADQHREPLRPYGRGL